MNIVIVGLGSMGRRRLRIVKSLVPNAKIIGVESNNLRRSEVEHQHSILTVPTLAEAIGSAPLDAAFICTSPKEHASIRQALNHEAIHNFSEINLSDEGYEEAVAFEESRRARCFLSSTPLYDKDVQHIMRAAEGNEVSYCYHVGQYLPDWHPWESYQSFFAGQKATNACREILVMELPWMVKAFSEVRTFHVVKRKLSDLDIDWPDTIHLLLEHENGSVGSVTFDAVSRRPVRTLEVFNAAIHLTWPGTPNSIQVKRAGEKEAQKVHTYGELKHEEGYAETIAENPYEEEVADFLRGLRDPDHEFAHNYRTDARYLRLVDQIENA